MASIVTAVALAMALLIGDAGVWAAQSALPGDALYGVKVASERVQLEVASSPQERFELYNWAAGKRLGEAVGILDRDRDRFSIQTIVEAEQLLARAEETVAELTQGERAQARETLRVSYVRLERVLAMGQARADRDLLPALTALRERVQAKLMVMEGERTAIDLTASSAAAEQTQPLSQDQTKTQTRTQTQTKDQDRTETRTQTQTRTQDQSQTQTRTQVETQGQTQTQTQTQDQSQTKTQSQTQTQTQSQTQTKQQTQTQARTGTGTGSFSTSSRGR